MNSMKQKLYTFQKTCNLRFNKNNHVCCDKLLASKKIVLIKKKDIIIYR